MKERDNREVAADGAAWDCVFAGEPFHTATTDRTSGTGYCRRRCSWHRPGSSGNTEHEAEILESYGEEKG